MGRARSLTSTDSSPGIRSDDRPPIPRHSLKQHRTSLHRIACNLNVLRILDFSSRSRQEKELQVTDGTSLIIGDGVPVLLETDFVA